MVDLIRVRSCSKCSSLFEEKDLDLSHDVPKYIGGKDGDGRRYLCKKCHDIYERKVMAVMSKTLEESSREKMRRAAKAFSKNYFNRGVNDANSK